MSERQQRIRYIEGPQGVGKSTASEYAQNLGFVLYRGIPVGHDLVANSETQNWRQSLKIMELAIASGKDAVTDRSLWSLVVYNMRKKPQSADLIYNIGSHMFRRGLNGALDHKIIIINSLADICIKRANPNSPVSIKNMTEAKSEIDAYTELLARLEGDGYEVYTLCNAGISKEEFLSQVKELLQ